MAVRTEDSVIDLYQRHGARWADLRDGSLVEVAWLDRFCALLSPKAEVLDIGCGSGRPIARELGQRGFKVTGVDAASTMLALFRSNMPDAPSVLCDMRRLAVGRRFAGLLAWDSFFHLSPDDQRLMFARFRDHADPYAALMFTSGVVEGTAIGTFEGEPLYHGSLGTEEYRAVLRTHGFRVIDHVVEDPCCGYRTVWLAQLSQ